MKKSHTKIDKPTLSIHEFKEGYLRNNYNENMFLPNGSINPDYNSNKKTGIIATIFEEHWDYFSIKKKEAILLCRPNANSEIQKIIDCHNKNLGCSVYECPHCSDFVFVGHTCKSRFCTSCGYKYKLLRVEHILDTAYVCNHRQIVFTCPRELRLYFFKNITVMISLYFKAVNLTINSILNHSFKKIRGKLKKYSSKIKYTPGFFAFLHTFGRDLKWNPHIHVLIAEMKLGDNNSFKKWDYFDFNALSKRFMYFLLELLLQQLGPSFLSVKNALYKKYKKGFYVYAEKKTFPSLEAGIEYVARYCGRPAISENRIISYDGQSVTFSYNDHYDDSYHEVTVSAFQFIEMIIRHLLPTHFKSIRYYGFYRKKHKLHDTMRKMVSDEKIPVRKQFLKYQMCIMKFFHYNPYNCPHCGTPMFFLCDLKGC